MKANLASSECTIELVTTLSQTIAGNREDIKHLSNFKTLFWTGVHDLDDYKTIHQAHHHLPGWEKMDYSFLAAVLQTALLSYWPSTMAFSYRLMPDCIQNDRSKASWLAIHIRRIQRALRRHSEFHPAIWITAVPCEDRNLAWRIRGAIGFDPRHRDRRIHPADIICEFADQNVTWFDALSLEFFDFDIQDPYALTGPYAWGQSAVRQLEAAGDELEDGSREPLYISRRLHDAARYEHRRWISSPLDMSTAMFRVSGEGRAQLRKDSEYGKPLSRQELDFAWSKSRPYRPCTAIPAAF